MASNRLRTVMRVIRATAISDHAASADAVLLRRFVTYHEDAAFAALVERHGPMVLGLCRRVLNNPIDAEDAFQGTFIVLACKAASIARPELLGTWLYRVAYRVALRARADLAKRREDPMNALDMAAAPRIPDVDWADLRPILDAEIDRLPERCRVPVVLCYLEGKTNDEAARLLGCARGTIASRLAWARERLRTRLVRRGISLPAALLGSVLAADVLSAAVPMTLRDMTVRTALTFFLGSAMPGATLTSGTALATGVLRAMLNTQIRKAIVVLMALGLVVGGVGFFTAQPGADAQPQQAAAEAATVQREKPNDRSGEKATAGDADAGKKLRNLLKQRRDAADKILEEVMKGFLQGKTLADTVYPASLRLLEAELDLSQSRNDRVKACEAHLACMKLVEKVYRHGAADGMFTATEGALAEFHRLDAEIRLEREKSK